MTTRHAKTPPPSTRPAAGMQLRPLTATLPWLAMALLLAASPLAAQPTGLMNATPVEGIFNGLTEIDRPGWFYYGLNAADRGLGYVGSYMTFGGFIPYAQDDLGGFWSADLRSHLSVYGGFFSNVGLVRKQFIGGTLLGVGIYWDYDGDENQYPNTFITDDSGSYLFGGGETYNQVGISGEWLTDWGNLRSNGYIPVGSTATTMGPFVGNSLLAVNGINAALGGADLEIGAYIPALTDWAGMISVGGYAFGNTRYQFPNGADVVPWFGGVYTRLDMSFVENWDFSLQANNDSFFDWTGFARLTYRLGGSRRRNVPDQVEQPLMRNEHIVRAHQAPVQAINPINGLPWRILHVDNSTAVVGSGNGTFESPFKELVDARDAATREFDIVFLHAGISHQTPYAIPVPPTNPLLNPDPTGTPPVYPNSALAGSYYFNANNQYLVGEGTSLLLNTVSNGPVQLDSGRKNVPYPVVTNAAGTAIALTNPAGTVTNATVDHVEIRNSYVGISDGGGLPANGYATANDVRIIGTGPSQRGVEITAERNSGRATFNFTNMQLRNLTRDGFAVIPTLTSLQEPQVNITDSSIRNTGGSAVYAENLFGSSRVRVQGTTIVKSSNSGILVDDAQLTLYQSRIRNTGLAGITIVDSSTVQVAQTTFADVDIGIQATATTGRLNITANDNVITPTRTGNGIMLATPSPTTDGEIYANINGNRILSGGAQDIVLFDGTPNPAPPGAADLWIKASSLENLVAINADASVFLEFPEAEQEEVPPPPNWQPSLFVPLPPP